MNDYPRNYTDPDFPGEGVCYRVQGPHSMVEFNHPTKGWLPSLAYDSETELIENGFQLER